MPDENNSALTSLSSHDVSTSWSVPRSSLPDLPSSSGAVWGTRRGIVRKDTEYVKQHAAYLQARTTQSSAMRDLVESRVALAVALSQLSAVPEICAAEYLKGRRERARDLLITDLHCQEAELRAKAAVASAQKHLLSLEPPLEKASEAAQPQAGLTPAEIDELVATMPDISDGARRTLSLLLHGRVQEKGP